MEAAQIRNGEVLNGKYRVDRVVGEGGMGFVVAALHLGLDEVVALKFLHPDCATDPNHVMRFQREARAAIKIKSDHVVRVMDVDTLASGEPFMVMEFLEGEDLAALVQRSGPQPVETAVSYVLEASEAVAEAHRLGIVHRDLKPSNLFLARRSDGSTSLKVLDFGISKVITGNLHDSFRITKKQEIFGSPMYMPPEQLTDAAEVDTRADIWSLGTILFELLCGAPPFRARSLAELCARILQGDTPSARSIRPEVPVELDNSIARCLVRDREQRWQSVEEFRDAIAPFAPGATRDLAQPQLRAEPLGPVRSPDESLPGTQSITTPEPEPRVALPARWQSRRRWLLAGGLACAFALTAVIAVMQTREVSPRRTENASGVAESFPVGSATSSTAVLPLPDSAAAPGVASSAPDSAYASPEPSPPESSPRARPVPAKTHAVESAPDAAPRDLGLDLFKDNQ